jgi:O-antigen/teichoic acid export membrane protein
MKRTLRRLWAKSSKDELTRNSSWMFLGNMLRIGLQAAYFVMIARFLGVRDYGIFVAVASMVAILSPFSGLGAGNILIMKVARHPSHFSEAWGKALFLAGITGVVLTVVVVIAARLVLPGYIGLNTILLVTVADLLGPRVADLGSMAFGAFHQFHWNAVLQIASTGFRTVAAGLMIVFINHPNAAQWVWFYAVSSVLMSVFSLGAVSFKLGNPSFRFSNLWEDVKEGTFFSLSTSAQTVYNDIDKAMLSRLSDVNSVGLYSAAYRIVDLGSAPMRSIAAAAYPTLFREGQHGLKPSMRYALKAFSRAALITGAMSLGMFLFAPLLPRLLGPGYRQSIDALRWLAILPVLKCAHVLFGDAMSGAGYQRFRAALQVGIAIFNVLINFWLIAAYSWRGACWSSLASDGALAVLVVGSGLLLCKKEAQKAMGQLPATGILVHPEEAIESVGSTETTAAR